MNCAPPHAIVVYRGGASFDAKYPTGEYLTEEFPCTPDITMGQVVAMCTLFKGKLAHSLQLADSPSTLWTKAKGFRYADTATLYNIMSMVRGDKAQPAEREGKYVFIAKWN